MRRLRAEQPVLAIGGDGLRTALLGVAISLVVVAPLTRRGWLLLLDWAPGPRSIGPTGSAALPTGPLFLWPALAAHALFGAASAWLPIAVSLAVAAAGSARLIGGPWAARTAAAVAYAWNPFVFDRIAAGQVSVLAGYALLPWIAYAALRAETIGGAWTVGFWWSAAAMCTLHFLWIGGVLIGAIALARVHTMPRRKLIAAAGAAVSAPIILASIVLAVARTHASAGNPDVLTTFATSSDHDLGRALGTLAQQGFWREAVTNPRADLGHVFPFVACAVVGLAAFGLVAVRSTGRARLALSVAIAAGAGWILAQGAAGPTGELYRILFEHLPGFSIMREAQKWVALISLATAVGLGCLATAIAKTRARRAAWLVVLVPVALAPTMAWGLGNRIEPSRYPASWSAVRNDVDALHADVVALPFEHYVLSGITGDRTVADVAPAYFGSHVIVSDDAAVPGLAGDTGRRAEIAAVIATARTDADRGRPLHLGADLARLGVRGVLVLADAPGVALGRDPGLVHVATAEHLDLWVTDQPR